MTLSSDKPSQIPKVLKLIRDMKATIEKEASAEQKSYDKYACWCEDTMARKAADIANGKETMKKLQVLIEKLNGDLGAISAEISQLKKDVSANKEAQKEATEIRDKENAEYVAEKTESEQCIGALEAAIKVLSGAGTGKKGFLETLNQAQLISVAADVKRVLQKDIASSTVAEQDLKAVQAFVSNPEEFARSGFTAMQVGQNPFGDYAPQSTQIQGILKGMYDSFTSSLEKANAEEGEKEKAFEELMATKSAELATLTTTLDNQQNDQASKKKLLADSETQLDDTKIQVEADENFFEKTKVSCKTKASEYSIRSRLRAEELVGVQKAIEILGSPDALKTFENSSATFLQVSSYSAQNARNRAYIKLRNLAAKNHALGLAQLATAVKEAGHFDKVIVMIDDMIKLLRKEEASDIEHRDKCERDINKNKNELEDLQTAIDKATASLDRMSNTKKDNLAQIDKLTESIKTTKQEMEDRLTLRNDEHKTFVDATKEDADALNLLKMASDALSAFYKKNKIPLDLVQTHEPEYQVDKDAAPETTWDDANYGGKSEKNKNILTILSYLIKDTKLEMEKARKDDAAAEADYEEDLAASNKVLKSQKESKAALETALADLGEKMTDKEAFKTKTTDELDAEKGTKDSLDKDCAWVKSNFDSRKKKREAELDGLQEAKSILAGAESGDFAELELSQS